MNLSENIANPPQNPIIHHHILRQNCHELGGFPCVWIKHIKHIGIKIIQNVLCI